MAKTEKPKPAPNGRNKGAEAEMGKTARPTRGRDSEMSLHSRRPAPTQPPRRIRPPRRWTTAKGNTAGSQAATKPMAKT